MSYAIKHCIGDSRAASANKGVSAEFAGIRVQLMNALSHVHHGAVLVYRLRTGQIESAAQCMLGEYFIPKRRWQSNEVEPLLVPGTLCPEVIGDLLMRFGWVRPVEAEESGFTRCFILSEAGEKALEGARTWWSSLSWFQKAWLCVTE